MNLKHSLFTASISHIAAVGFADESDAVMVSISLSPTGAPNRQFGEDLIIYPVTAAITERDEAVRAGTVSRYQNANALPNDVTGVVRDAVLARFSQSPFPREVLVAAHHTVAQVARIWGGDVTVADVEALGDGVSLTLDGNTLSADFDTLSTLAAVATALSAAINASDAYTGITVAVEGESLLITAPEGTDFGSGFTDTAASQALGLTVDTGAEVTPEAEVETASQALDRIVDIDPGFTWVVPTSDTLDASIIAMATWVRARPYIYGLIFDISGRAALVPNESASLGATQSALGGLGIAAVWNGLTAADVDNKAMRLISRGSNINFNARNAVPNFKFQTLSGARPTELSAAARSELKRKRINYYIPVGRSNNADTEEGHTFGTWLDTYVWLMWFRDALHVAGYNFLKAASPLGGIAIDDQGLGSMSDALEAVCRQGVRNGGIGPGQASPAFRNAIAVATDDPSFDGSMSTGFVVVRPRAANISQADRNARAAIPYQIYVKGRGKINNLELFGYFEE